MSLNIQGADHSGAACCEVAVRQPFGRDPTGDRMTKTCAPKVWVGPIRDPQTISYILNFVVTIYVSSSNQVRSQSCALESHILTVVPRIES